MSQQPKRPKVIHVRKFENVNGMTPQEMHAEGLARKCPCGLAATCRAISFAPAEELVKRAPALLGQIMLINGGEVPVVEFTYGKFIKIGEVFACNLCRVSMERQAAKGPSWVLVNIETGPEPIRPSVQVPGGGS